MYQDKRGQKGDPDGRPGDDFPDAVEGGLGGGRR
jgi:hypothetical protein